MTPVSHTNDQHRLGDISRAAPMNEEFRRFSAAKEGELVFPGEVLGYRLYNSELSAEETYFYAENI